MHTTFIQAAALTRANACTDLIVAHPEHVRSGTDRGAHVHVVHVLPVPTHQEICTAQKGWRCLTPSTDEPAPSEERQDAHVSGRLMVLLPWQADTPIWSVTLEDNPRQGRPSPAFKHNIFPTKPNAARLPVRCNCP